MEKERNSATPVAQVATQGVQCGDMTGQTKNQRPGQLPKVALCTRCYRLHLELESEGSGEGSRQGFL